jgi:hypothetical protein
VNSPVPALPWALAHGNTTVVDADGFAVLEALEKVRE